MYCAKSMLMQFMLLSPSHRSKPFSFKVGCGEVIKAWDEAVPQVRLRLLKVLEKSLET